MTLGRGSALVEESHLAWEWVYLSHPAPDPRLLPRLAAILLHTGATR